MRWNLIYGFVLGCLSALLLAAGAAAQLHGTAKLGYIYTDEEGNFAAYQPTYNLYDGVDLSLENFSYYGDQGLRVRGDARHLTLKNRNVRADASYRHMAGVNLSYAQYRRNYSFAGDHSVRRDRSAGSIWIKPHRYVKIYGGYGLTNREGELVELFDPGITVTPHEVDYQHQYFHAGTQVNYQGSMIQGEYRVGDFTNELRPGDDRQSTRFRAVAITPFPRYHRIQLQGGFQHFEHEIDSLGQKLTANTGWGGGRLQLPLHFAVRYSFIFDRAENTGDIVETDNIVQSVDVTKAWPGLAQVTVGYQHAINDDFFDEAQANSFFVTGSWKPSSVVSFKGVFGLRAEEIKEGATLLGDEDRTRYRLSMTYTRDGGTMRLWVEDKRRENADLGSEVEFRRVATDLTLSKWIPGEVVGSYAFSQGDYDNVEDEFTFEDHLLTGRYEVPVIKQLSVYAGGTYYRSKRDLYVEHFSVLLGGTIHIIPDYGLEVNYAAHNFDDFRAFRRYYTANIVQIMLVKEL